MLSNDLWNAGCTSLRAVAWLGKSSATATKYLGGTPVAGQIAPLPYSRGALPGERRGWSTGQLPTNRFVSRYTLCALQLCVAADRISTFVRGCYILRYVKERKIL